MCEEQFVDMMLFCFLSQNCKTTTTDMQFVSEHMVLYKDLQKIKL